MEGNPCVTAVYLGDNLAGDEGDYAQHFGMCGGSLDGSIMELRVPLSLYELCSRNDINAVFWTGFPETAGHISPPYQTKARNLIPYVVPPQRLAELDLGRSLQNSISFEVTPWLMRWVEARLQNRIGLGERKLCLIGRNGYTSVGKNWGHLWREDLPAGTRRE